MDGQPHGGHPFRQYTLNPKGNSVSGASVPTAVPTSRRRVLVCGGRDFADRDAVFRQLDSMCGDITDEHPLGTISLTIIHGACPTGADHWADEWVIVNWAQFEEYPADWDKHGKAAGPIRNRRMLEEGKPDIVIAFPGGRGTADMVRQAEAAGVPVVKVAPAASQEAGL